MGQILFGIQNHLSYLLDLQGPQARARCEMMFGGQGGVKLGVKWGVGRGASDQLHPMGHEPGCGWVSCVLPDVVGKPLYGQNCWCGNVACVLGQE